MEITLADWIIVGATVISAIATAVSTVVAVRLGKIVTDDHLNRVRHMQSYTRSPISEVMGSPIQHVRIDDFSSISIDSIALDTIADVCLRMLVQMTTR